MKASFFLEVDGNIKYRAKYWWIDRKKKLVKPVSVLKKSNGHISEIVQNKQTTRTTIAPSPLPPKKGEYLEILKKDLINQNRFLKEYKKQENDFNQGRDLFNCQINQYSVQCSSKFFYCHKLFVVLEIKIHVRIRKASLLNFRFWFLCTRKWLNNIYFDLPTISALTELLSLFHMWRQKKEMEYYPWGQFSCSSDQRQVIVG